MLGSPCAGHRSSLGGGVRVEEGQAGIKWVGSERQGVTGACGREKEKVNEKNLMRLMIDNEIRERERIV